MEGQEIRNREAEVMFRLAFRLLGVAGLLGALALGRFAFAEDSCGKDCQARVLAGAAGSTTATAGAVISQVPDLVQPPYEGNVYTGTRKGSGSTYSVGDPDVGSTTRDPAIRGREKGTKIETSHRVISNDPDDLARVERALQNRVPNTSRPATVPGGRPLTTPRTAAAADDIAQALSRGATETVQDLRSLSGKAASACASHPNVCKNAGRALTAAGAAVVAGAMLIPDPSDIVLVDWCDAGTEVCPDGTRQCRNTKCAGHDLSE